MDPITKKYEVLGEEGASVDVVGTAFTVGDTVDLRDDVAAPLVAAGTLKEVEAVAADADADADADDEDADTSTSASPSPAAAE
jgi:hypothetical protein